MIFTRVRRRTFFYRKIGYIGNFDISRVFASDRITPSRRIRQIWFATPCASSRTRAEYPAVAFYHFRRGSVQRFVRQTLFCLFTGFVGRVIFPYGLRVPRIRGGLRTPARWPNRSAECFSTRRRTFRRNSCWLVYCIKLIERTDSIVFRYDTIAFGHYRRVVPLTFTITTAVDFRTFRYATG